MQMNRNVPASRKRAVKPPAIRRASGAPSSGTTSIERKRGSAKTTSVPASTSRIRVGKSSSRVTVVIDCNPSAAPTPVPSPSTAAATGSAKVLRRIAHPPAGSGLRRPPRRLLERGDHGRVVRGPGALAFVPVDLDLGAALGQRRAQQDVVDPEPPIPVKRAGPVVPPRVETSLLGPVDPERVGQPPGEERAEGAPLGLARHDVTAPLLGIPDVAILGRDIEVAADDDVLAGVDLALKEGQEPAVPAELVSVPGRAQLAAVGRVDVHDARAAARGDEEPARGVRSVARDRADHLRAR